MRRCYKLYYLNNKLIFKNIFLNYKIPLQIKEVTMLLMPSNNCRLHFAIHILKYYILFFFKVRGILIKNFRPRPQKCVREYASPYAWDWSTEGCNKFAFFNSEALHPNNAASNIIVSY